jgi:hypothetical protein
MRIEDRPEQSEQEDSRKETLEACVLALSRWKEPLPPDLHYQIQSAGKQLLEQEAAVYELRNLLYNSELKDSFEAARQELFKKSFAVERSKSGLATPPSGNLLFEMAASILTADDFSSAAQRIVTQPTWQTRVKNASDDVQTFFHTLKKAVTELDSLSLKLLQILDQDIFTIDRLAYRVELPETQVKPVLEDLWRQNYIRPISSTVLGNILGPLNIFTDKQGSLDTDNHYLGLTVKGYYFLHPHPIYRAIAKAK